MKTKTYFAFRVDVWDSAANSIVEQIAGIEDFEVAVAAYWAAVAQHRSRPLARVMRFKLRRPEAANVTPLRAWRRK